MWKLKVSEGKEEESVNNHVGRQFWEYLKDSNNDLGSSQQLEQLRNHFTNNRFQTKHSSDLFMRLQFAKEYYPCEMLEKKVKMIESEEEEEEIREEVVTDTLTRALRFYSILQTEDGFWPGDYGGPLFLLPGLV
ncbi:hypothetical protein Q3G72_026989 [Acer saccharum]|nr:hypothetical protein Q3G72_026989 [Acer saccharum]